MMELNKVLLVGNLTRDPVFRSTGTGRSVIDFSLAVNRRMGVDRESGERQEETVFVDVTAWEKTAEWGRNYLRKGMRVFVEGRLRLDKWNDRETQQPRSKLAVTAERVQFAESRAEADARMSRGGEGGGYDDEGGAPRSAAPPSRPAAAAPRSEPAYDVREDYHAGGSDTKDDLPF